VNARRLSHLREDRLRGLTSRGEPEKSESFGLPYNRNDVSLRSL